MENKNKKRKTIDLIIEIVLVIIIVLLLIHNCGMKNQGDIKRSNGNVDIIEIMCNDKKCDIKPDDGKNSNDNNSDSNKPDNNANGKKHNNSNNNNGNNNNNNNNDSSSQDDDDSHDFEVFDDDNTPTTWDGSTDLKIFEKSIYNYDGNIAPESENTYEFIVRNKSAYRIKYSIEFVETNDHNINMKYKLRKGDTYIIDHYVSASELNTSNVYINAGDEDDYYLDWKWISSSNDTEIGKIGAEYKLQINVEAEES